MSPVWSPRTWPHQRLAAGRGVSQGQRNEAGGAEQMKFAQELLQGLLERLLFWTIAVVIGALVLIVLQWLGW